MSRVEDITDRALYSNALQRRGELLGLVKLVDELNPSVVLEIGTCHGGTLRAWMECAADDALIISIDLPHGPFGGGYSQTKRGMEEWLRPGASQRLELIGDDSHLPEVFEGVERMLDGRPIDFLFIDGDHTYLGVADDFWSYGALVRPGGLIALHDIVPHPESDEVEVHRFWAELADVFDTTAILSDGDYAGCGIGWLTRPRIWTA